MSPSQSQPCGAEKEPLPPGAAPSAACGCVATMNEVLRPHNTALVVPLMGPPRCLVEGYQIQGGRGSKRAVKVFANYCPFCGDKYAHADTSERPAMPREEQSK